MPKTIQSGRRKTPRSRRGSIRYGVVGLGWFAQTAVLPAFAHAKENSKLVAFFSDDEKKLRTLGRRYRVSELHAYTDFDEVLASGVLDAVYLVVPNHLHRDFTLRAARGGVHILCEKPMAVTERDCEAMIAAAKRSRVKLMVAYRLHFDRSNLEAAKIVQSGRIGEPLAFHSVFTNLVTDPNNIRLGPVAKGGGTLYDIGIYCVNAARSIFRAEPVEVAALSVNRGEKRFRRTDETTGVILKFPGERIATFTSTFAGASTHFYQILGTKGDLRVEPGFEFAQESSHRLTIGGKTSRRTFPKRDQVGPEIVYFSDCILRNREPEPSGREGLADVRVIQALYRSAKTGRAIRLAPFEKRSRPDIRQQIHRPPVGKQKLVGVRLPSDE